MPSDMHGDQQSNTVSDESDVCSVISFEDSGEAEESVHEDDDTEVPKRFTCPSVIWTGLKKRTPVLIFKADAVVSKDAQQRLAGEQYHLAYKMGKTECKLVRNILNSHGFHEAHLNSSDYNLMWTGSHLKPYVLRGMLEFQKVNHFPRSYEVTRKDRLYKNIQKMQQIKGYKHFDFVPQTFVIPSEFQDFCAAAYKEKGIWIVKPAALSRGRGIYLATSPEQVSMEENVVICRYIANPFLINGFKFDIRLYVAVTSFDPLLIYLYEEGLTRFATVKFDKNFKSIRNSCMHLTNYSVNKRNSDYVSNDDADIEDFGNKWSLGALLRYLRTQGIDTTAMMMSIEDVIIKTLISVELPIASACKMYQPYRGNCFELFGFDILVDENLRPWVLEVNLSPSLACDAPLDLKIKSNMISDLFSLVGFECHDPMMRKPNPDGYYNPRTRPALRAQKGSWWKSRISLHLKRRRPDSAVISMNRMKHESSNADANNTSLTNEELRVLRLTKEEYSRRGGWVRIFPTPDTWDTYSSYLQFSSSLNSLLHQNLFGDISAEVKSSSSKQRLIHLHSTPNSQMANGLQNNIALVRAMQRSKQYERKLNCLGQDSNHESLNPQRKRTTSILNSGRRSQLVQGSPEESSSTLSLISKQDDGTCADGKQGPIVKDVNENFDVIKLLENGMSMSKCQARFAFSTYLNRVKERLLDETDGKQEINEDSANEQMDLVIKFLQRAANNLQHPFKLVIPNRKLPLSMRRHTLAKQLHKFISVYDKETDDLKWRIEAEKSQTTDSSNFFNDNQFYNFVSSASESELEEVLILYTRLKKSPSIFLKSSSKPCHSQPTYNAASVGRCQDTCLPKRRDSSETSRISSTKPTGWETVAHGGSGSQVGNIASHTSNGCNSGVGVPLLPANIASRLTPNAMSSYANAVSIYSTRMGSSYPHLKYRSASVNSQQGRAAEIMFKPSHHHNEGSTNILPKHTIKQKLRQHCASSSSVTNATSSEKNGYYQQRHRQSNNDNFSNAKQGEDESESSTVLLKSRRSTLKKNSKVSSSGVGVVAANSQSHRSSMSSLDGSIYYQAQQDMIEQSRALLEESKAKHHALVAQAHDIQKQLLLDKQCHIDTSPNAQLFTGVLAPQPPSKPNRNERRHRSRSNRLVKTVSYDESQHSQDCTSDVDSQGHPL